MSAATVTLQPADRSTLSYVETRLAENGLPTDDIQSKPERFYVAYDGDTCVGIGGLEIAGAEGLLRSVVIERSVRGIGLGTALCDALEATASAAGVETLYLLTTTATGFFAQRGYVPIERADAPRSIRETTEFADLCPANATCMTKPL